MPTYPFTLGTWVSGSGTYQWANPGNAEFLDGSDTTTILNLAADPSLALMGTNPSVLGSSFAANEVLESITLNAYRYQTQNNGGGASATDLSLYLVVAGSPVTSINFASASQWPGTLTEASYTVTSANLTSLGITAAQLTSGFGVALAVQRGVQLSVAVEFFVDQIAGVFTTSYVSPTVIAASSQVLYLPPFAVKSA